MLLIKSWYLWYVIDFVILEINIKFKIESKINVYYNK